MTNVYLPKTDNPIRMPGAIREDALIIAVQRDGTMYLGMDKVTVRMLPELLEVAVRGGSERKAYIKADARAKYGAVVLALNAVRNAGIDNVELLTEPRIFAGQTFGLD
jgi:biopolymer transport protein ExbD/biopolymer transport protein TolR